jgi:prevent-host-death family protein
MLTQEAIGVSEAKAKLTSILRRLESGEQDRAILFRQNHPIAVLIPIAVYERLEKMQEDLEHYEDALALAKAQAINDGTTYSLEEVATKLDVL